MKNVKSIFRISIVILVLISNSLYAKVGDVSDKFEKSFKISDSDKLELSMYDSDLQINTWANSEIKLTGDIVISGGDKEDIEKLLNAFKNPEVNQGGGRIEIDTRFSEGMITVLGIYKKLKLINGDNVSITSYKANYTIWVPEKIAFKLISKYNSIKSANLLGSLDFELYNVNLDMGNFGDNSKFDMKYSTINAGKGKDARFELYDSKVYANEMNKIIVDSKYSKLNCKSVNLVVLESYNDDFDFDNLNGIDINAKYTKLNAKGNANLGKFNLYDCNIVVDNFKKIEYDSKYSEINANVVGEFSIKTSYNDTYEVKEVGDFSCLDSKYNKFQIGLVNSSINLPDTYDTQFAVNKCGSGFTSFKGEFKYGDVKLTFDPLVSINLEFESTYGDITFPKDKFKKPYTSISGDTKTQFEGSTDANAKCNIKFKTYDTKFTIE